MSPEKKLKDVLGHIVTLTSVKGFSVERVADLPWLVRYDKIDMSPDMLALVHPYHDKGIDKLIILRYVYNAGDSGYRPVVLAPEVRNCIYKHLLESGYLPGEWMMLAIDIQPPKEDH